MNSWMGIGLPPEVPWVVLPYALYLTDSDLTVLDPKINEIIGCLTTYKPKTTYTKGQIIAREPITVTGKDQFEWLSNVQNMYLTQMWGDGAAVYPATKDRVDWILTGTDKARTAVVGSLNGKVAAKGGILSEEVLATCMAMAGGRPEYMPVAEAACDGAIAKQLSLSSSISAYPGALVNGPVVEKIRLSAGFGMFGPDPQRAAGYAIKRCLWFVYQDVGGFVASLGTIAQYADLRPGLVFGENEIEMPKGWTTYAFDYYNRAAGTNSVTVFSGNGSRGFTYRGTGAEPTHKIELSEGLDRAAQVIIAAPSSGVPGNSAGSSGMLLMNAAIAADMIANGWPDKASIKKDLAARLWYLLDEVIERTGIQRSIADAKIDVSTLPKKCMLYTNPDMLRLVISGGNHPSRGMWLPSYSPSANTVVTLPKSWDSLLAQALKDLGPMPPWM
jgi:hypothetical protein